MTQNTTLNSHVHEERSGVVRLSRGRFLRLVGAVAVACGSVPLTGVGVAQADSVALAPSNSGYFYAMGIDKPEASPADPPNLTADRADGVSPGNLGVAAQGGAEDKVSFLYFDVFNLPVGATIDKAVVTLKLVPNSPPNDISYNQAPELVAACKAGSSGFAEDDGTGMALAPERLCKDFSAAAKEGPGGTYQWDVTALAQTWMTGENDGLAFTAANADPGTNFQVVFDKASTAKLDVTYTPAVVVEPVVDPPAVAPGPALPPVPTTGFEPAPPVGTVTDPGVVAPEPTVNPVPSPVTSQPVTNVAAPVALEGSLRPTTAFWLGSLGLLVALAAASLVLGDASPAATTRRRRSRLSHALSHPDRLAAVRMVGHRTA